MKIKMLNQRKAFDKKKNNLRQFKTDRANVKANFKKKWKTGKKEKKKKDYKIIRPSIIFEMFHSYNVTLWR